MATTEPDKEVGITLNSTGLPVPSDNPIPVKKDKQKIRWSAPFAFSIDIQGYTNVKYSQSGGVYTAKTGVFTDPVGTHYKYSITANGQTHDPDIDVIP